MSPEKLGSVIGAAFGLVFVVVNTGSLPTAPAVVLRGLAVVAFVVVVIAAVRRREATGGRAMARGGFGRGYWLVVAAEVVAIWGGLALLNGPLSMPQAAVAWISSVVGAHFVALAVVWRNPLFHRLGAALLACGLVGLVLAAGGADVAVIQLVGGVLPGVILLGVGLRAVTRDVTTPSTAAAR